VRIALKKTLLGSFTDVIKVKQKYKLPDLRNAAMVLAVNRVARALQLRGAFP
jgi:glutamate dehydrogenase/leucine dehydrogenase